VGSLEPGRAPRDRLNPRFMAHHAVHMAFSYYVCPAVIVPFASYFGVWVAASIATAIAPYVVVATSWLVAIILLLAFLPGLMVLLTVSLFLTPASYNLALALTYRSLLAAFLLRAFILVGPRLGLDPVFWVNLVFAVLTVQAGIRAAFGDFSEMNKLPGYVTLYLLARNFVPLPALPLQLVIEWADSTLFNTYSSHIAAWLWKLILSLFF